LGPSWRVGDRDWTDQWIRENPKRKGYKKEKHIGGFSIAANKKTLERGGSK